jgi:hypothetical protein
MPEGAFSGYADIAGNCSNLDGQAKKRDARSRVSAAARQSAHMTAQPMHSQRATIHL